METVKIGIIGGSGLYQMPELDDIEEIVVETPFGPPSDAFIVGTLENNRVAFLPRHGRGHRFTPTELPFRANIYGMKLLGVERILSASAVGSLQEEYAPLDMVIPDQFFDRTRARARESTFFGEGIVAHVAFAHPVCEELGNVSLHGRPGVLHEGRVGSLSSMGHGRYWDDKFAGSQAGARSGNLLRNVGAGDGLRLLASGSRCRDS